MNSGSKIGIDLSQWSESFDLFENMLKSLIENVENAESVVEGFSNSLSRDSKNIIKSFKDLPETTKKLSKYYTTLDKAQTNVTESLKKFNKAQKENNATGIKSAAGDIVRYSNAFQALGGDLDNISQKVKKTYEAIKKAPKDFGFSHSDIFDEKSYNYSMKNMQKLFDIMKKMQDQGLQATEGMGKYFTGMFSADELTKMADKSSEAIKEVGEAAEQTGSRFENMTEKDAEAIKALIGYLQDVKAAVSSTFDSQGSLVTFSEKVENLNKMLQETKKLSEIIIDIKNIEALNDLVSKKHYIPIDIDYRAFNSSLDEITKRIKELKDENIVLNVTSSSRANPSLVGSAGSIDTADVKALKTVMDTEIEYFNKTGRSILEGIQNYGIYGSDDDDYSLDERLNQILNYTDDQIVKYMQSLYKTNLIDKKSDSETYKPTPTGSMHDGDGSYISSKYAIIRRNHYLDEDEKGEGAYESYANSKEIYQIMENARKAGAQVAEVFYNSLVDKTDAQGDWYEVQSKLAGKGASTVKYDDASLSQYANLIKDMNTIVSLGGLIETGGDNVLYDAKKGFSIIDIANAKTSKYRSTASTPEELYAGLIDSNDYIDRAKVQAMFDKVEQALQLEKAGSGVQTLEVVDRLDTIVGLLTSLNNKISYSGVNDSVIKMDNIVDAKDISNLNNYVARAKDFGLELKKVFDSNGNISGYRFGTTEQDEKNVSRAVYQKYSKALQAFDDAELRNSQGDISGDEYNRIEEEYNKWEGLFNAEFNELTEKEIDYILKEGGYIKENNEALEKEEQLVKAVFSDDQISEFLNLLTQINTNISEMSTLFGKMDDDSPFANLTEGLLHLSSTMDDVFKKLASVRSVMGKSQFNLNFKEDKSLDMAQSKVLEDQFMKTQYSNWEKQYDAIFQEFSKKSGLNSDSLFDMLSHQTGFEGIENVRDYFSKDAINSIEGVYQQINRMQEFIRRFKIYTESTADPIQEKINKYTMESEAIQTKLEKYRDVDISILETVQQTDEEIDKLISEENKNYGAKLVAEQYTVDDNGKRIYSTQLSGETVESEYQAKGAGNTGLSLDQDVVRAREKEVLLRRLEENETAKQSFIEATRNDDTLTKLTEQLSKNEQEIFELDKNAADKGFVSLKNYYNKDGEIKKNLSKDLTEKVQERQDLLDQVYAAKSLDTVLYDLAHDTSVINKNVDMSYIDTKRQEIYNIKEEKPKTMVESVTDALNAVVGRGEFAENRSLKDGGLSSGELREIMDSLKKINSYLKYITDKISSGKKIAEFIDGLNNSFNEFSTTLLKVSERLDEIQSVKLNNLNIDESVEDLDKEAEATQEVTLNMDNAAEAKKKFAEVNAQVASSASESSSDLSKEAESAKEVAESMDKAESNMRDISNVEMDNDLFDNIFDNFMESAEKAKESVKEMIELMTTPPSNGLEQSLEQEVQTLDDIKKKQLEIIQSTNPKNYDWNPGATWVESTDDIKTWKEAMDDPDYNGYGFTPDFTWEDALNVEKAGTVTVYSSKPIENGNFVTPSYMEAQGYAGDGQIYSKEMNVNDIAWIDIGQGQVAIVSDLAEGLEQVATAEQEIGQSNSLEFVGQSAKKSSIEIVDLNKELEETDNNLDFFSNETSVLSDQIANEKRFKQISTDTISIITDQGKSEDEVISKIREEIKAKQQLNELNEEYLILIDKAGKIVANHKGSTTSVDGSFTEEQLNQAKEGKLVHVHPGQASFFGGKDLTHMLRDEIYSEINQIDLMWGDSTLSIDKSSLTKQSQSTLLNIMKNVRTELIKIYEDNGSDTPSQEAREHINAIEKEIFKSIASKLNVSVLETGQQSKDVVDALSDVDKAIIQKFRNIKNNIIQDINPSDIISSSTQTLKQSAANDAKALDSTDEMKAQGEENAEAFIDAEKEVLGIHSPSEELRKIGLYCDQGLVNGLKEGSKDILLEVNEIRDMIINAFKEGGESQESVFSWFDSLSEQEKKFGNRTTQAIGMLRGDTYNLPESSRSFNVDDYIADLKETRHILSQSNYQDRVQFVEETNAGQTAIHDVGLDSNGNPYDAVTKVLTNFQSVEKEIMSLDAAISKSYTDIAKNMRNNKFYDPSALQSSTHQLEEQRDLLLDALDYYSQEAKYAYDIDAFTAQRIENQKKINAARGNADALMNAQNLQKIEKVNKTLDARLSVLDAIQNTYDESMNPSGNKLVKNEQDLLELEEKRKSIVTKINELRNTNVSTTEMSELETMISEYKLLAKNKQASNNPTTKSLQGNDSSVKISELIAQYDKLILKSSQYGKTTEQTTNNLKKQRAALKSILENDSLSTEEKTRAYYNQGDEFKIAKAEFSAQEAEIKRNNKEIAQLFKDRIKTYKDILRLQKTINTLDEEYDAEEIANLQSVKKLRQEEFLDYTKQIKSRIGNSASNDIYALSNDTSVATLTSKVKSNKRENLSTQYRNENEIIKDAIKNLNTYYQLKAKDNNTFSAEEQNQWNKVRNSIESADKILNQYIDDEGNLNTKKITNRDLVKNLTAYSNRSAIGTGVENITQNANKLVHALDLNRYTTNFVSEVNSLQSKVNELNKLQLNINADNIVQSIPAIAQLENEIIELMTQIKGLSKSDDAYVISEEKLNQAIANTQKTVNKNTNMSSELRVEYEKQIAELKELAQNYKAVDKTTFNNIMGNIAKLNVELQTAGKTGRSFFDLLKTKIYRNSVQTLSMYFGLYDFIRYGQEAITTIEELDTALVDLKKTTTMTTSQLEDFYLTASDTASQVGVTTEEIISQAAAWSRLGYSSSEAATQMAKLSSQFAAISPDMDTDTATDGLVSIMQAYGYEVDDVLDGVMSKINQIGNTMATTNGEIVTMLEKSSSSMKEANNTLEETIALESAAVEITRDADSVGRSAA